MSRLLIIWSLILLPMGILAQQIDAVLSPGRAQIGDTFELVLKFTNKRMGNLVFPTTQEMIKGISHHQKIDKVDVDVFYRDSIGNENNMIFWKRTFSVIAWDTGIFVVQDLKCNFDDLVVDVPTQYFSVETSNTKNAQFNPLNEYFVSLEYKKNNLWILVIPILSIIFIFFYVRYVRRKKLRSHIQMDRDFLVDPIEKIRLEIMHLRLSEYWKEDRILEHYTQLSLSLKTFVGEILLSNNQELTTEDVAALFAEYSLPPKLVDEFIQLLDEADQVKFAKLQVSEEHIKKTLARADKATTELGLLIINLEDHD